MRLARLTLVLLLAVASLLPMPAASGQSAGVVDGELTGRLRGVLDARRAAVAQGPLFSRSHYLADAEAIAHRALVGTTAVSGRDNAPAAVRVFSVADLDADPVAVGLNQLATSLEPWLANRNLTDGGWSVVVARSGGGYRVAAAAVVGWPAPRLPAVARCTGWGYCWNAGGPNPHTPWTRNKLRWYASTANLTPAGEEVLRAALHRVNSVPGLGVDLAYGGRVPVTDITAAYPFLTIFADACVAPGALGCAEVTVHGPYEYVHGSRVVVQLREYRRQAANRELWIGTVAHEIAHSLGLDHYDARFAGRYQLMRSGGGSNHPQAGDGNGLRTVAPPGQPLGRARLRSSVLPRGGTAVADVTAWSSGLGGVRQVRVDCRDATGAWRMVARAAGVWDVTERAHVLAWRADRSTTCRLVVRAKARDWYAAPFGLTVR